jgi:hypothetical protein
VRVYLEVGTKRVFACAEDWPGWSRSGRNEEAAIEALLSYADRYAPVAPELEVDDPVITERIPGDGSTDFGAPGRVPPCDVDRPLPDSWIDIMMASWQLLDDIVAEAPAALRKGPRGGGRDRDAVVQHVVSAERSYARQLGVKHKEPAFADPAAVSALRADIVAALRDGTAEFTWPARYFVRRTTWHVLDHAWEIQDKSA